MRIQCNSLCMETTFSLSLLLHRNKGRTRDIKRGHSRVFRHTVSRFLSHFKLLKWINIWLRLSSSLIYNRSKTCLSNSLLIDVAEPVGTGTIQLWLQTALLLYLSLFITLKWQRENRKELFGIPLSVSFPNLYIPPAKDSSEGSVLISYPYSNKPV